MLDLAEQACARGDLIEYRPLFGGDPLRRRLLLPTDMASALKDPSLFSLKYDLGVLHNDLEVFVTGKILTFATGTHKSCMLKVLDPWSDEVWEIRSRGIKPGVRVFGRFAAQDVFVATSMTDRSETDFAQEIRRSKAAWRNIFNTYPPFSGQVPNDYISENLVDLRT